MVIVSIGFLTKGNCVRKPFPNFSIPRPLDFTWILLLDLFNWTAFTETDNVILNLFSNSHNLYFKDMFTQGFLCDSLSHSSLRKKIAQKLKVNTKSLLVYICNFCCQLEPHKAVTGKCDKNRTKKPTLKVEFYCYNQTSLLQKIMDRWWLLGRLSISKLNPDLLPNSLKIIRYQNEEIKAFQIKTSCVENEKSNN